jgi:hypothetical protein
MSEVRHENEEVRRKTDTPRFDETHSVLFSPSRDVIPSLASFDTFSTLALQIHLSSPGRMRAMEHVPYWKFPVWYF